MKEIQRIQRERTAAVAARARAGPSKDVDKEQEEIKDILDSFTPETADAIIMEILKAYGIFICVHIDSFVFYHVSLNHSQVWRGHR